MNAEQEKAVFALWATELPLEVGYRTADLIAEIERRPALFAAFEIVARSPRQPQQIDPTRLGIWLRKNCDTVAGGWKLTIDRRDQQRPRWTLTLTRLQPESPACSQ